MGSEGGSVVGHEAVRLADVDADVRGALVRATVLRAVAITVTLVGTYYLLPDSLDAGAGVVARIVGGLVALVAVVGWSLRSLRRARYPQLRAVEVSALALAALVVVFAFGYLSMSANDPAAFDEPLGHTDALYFTLTTVTTVGFGDIAPKTEAARGLVMVQMVADFVLIGAGLRLLAHVARQRLEGFAPATGAPDTGP